jgi:hypothetical protein
MKQLTRRKLLEMTAAGAVASLIPLPLRLEAGDDVDRWLAEHDPDYPASITRILAQAERLSYAEENPRAWRDAQYAGGISFCPGVAIVYGLNGRRPSPPEAVGIARDIEAAGFAILATGYSDDRRGWAHMVRGDNDAVRRVLKGYWLAADEEWPASCKSGRRISTGSENPDSVGSVVYPIQ